MTPTKIQLYYIYKFNTERLKDSNYNLKITPSQARKSGELVSIGESQMLKSLRDIKGQYFTHEDLNQLFENKRKLKISESTSDNILALRQLEHTIDDILFVPEIISIVVDDTRHYEEIIKDGLFINHRRFVRLMCSAGQMRRNNVLFVDEGFELKLKKILNNDRKDIEINPSKFNAYFALSSSTAIPVTKPYFTIVSDLEVVRKEKVEFIEEQENGDDIISIQEKEIVFNLFDGQGIISPRQAKIWAKDLGLNYIPSAFIIRSNFIKGLVVVIDFIQFSDEIGQHYITDIYGNKVNIRDMDVILTKSQFKLADAYDSVSDYLEKCEKNGWLWWVSRYAPEFEPHHTFTNYQFLQALKLDTPKKIEKICGKTVEYFGNTIKNDLNYTLLYLLGKHAQVDEVDSNDFLSRIQDVITKTLILNNELIEDPYIQQHLVSRLNRRIRESYIGKLLIDGFYTFAISDPYAFLEHIFGLPVKGLLSRGQHYNKFYVDKESDRIVSMRAPLTWRSEVNNMEVVINKEIEKWYQYITTGAVYNIHGVDCMLMADSDFDGDIVCLTDEPEIINNTYGGLPIYYETQATKKERIIEESLYQYDLKGFNPKIGFLTNCSTTMYAMLPNFKKNSAEHTEIVRRLKQCRKEQGSIIDSAKGLVVRPIPKHWTKWIHISEDMSDEERERAELSNSILVDKRPEFMTYLYDNYSRDQRTFDKNYEIYAMAELGVDVTDIVEKEENGQILSEHEALFLESYHRFNPFLSTDYTVNNISSYMQSKIKEIKYTRKEFDQDKILKILKNTDIEVDKRKLKQLYNLYKRYKSEKRKLFTFRNDSDEPIYKTLEQYDKAIRNEAYNGISSNIQELANLALTICYEIHPSDNKSFAWNVFGEGIVENVRKNRQNKVLVPCLDNHGDIEYLGEKYSMIEISVGGDPYANIL